MRSKHIPLLMSILICITMISVGFSSWVTLNPPTDGSQSGTMTSYPVYESTNFITYGEVQTFKFSSLSFLDDDGQSDVGTITVNYTVKLDSCYAEVGDADWTNGLTLNFSLWYANTAEEVNNLFERVDTETNLREVTVAATTTAGTINGGRVDGTDYSVFNSSFKLTGVPKSGECTVTVTYTFNVPMNLQDNSGVPANFRQMLGKYIKVNATDPTQNTQFLTSARIVEVE